MTHNGSFDNNYDAFVTRRPGETAFPTTAGAFDVTHNGRYDAFVTRLDTTGSALSYSTLLGGRSTIRP